MFNTSVTASSEPSVAACFKISKTVFATPPLPLAFIALSLPRLANSPSASFVPALMAVRSASSEDIPLWVASLAAFTAALDPAIKDEAEVGNIARTPISPIDSPV